MGIYCISCNWAHFQQFYVSSSFLKFCKVHCLYPYGAAGTLVVLSNFNNVSLLSVLNVYWIVSNILHIETSTAYYMYHHDLCKMQDTSSCLCSLSVSNLLSSFPLNATIFVLTVEILKLHSLHITRNMYNMCWSSSVLGIIAWSQANRIYVEYSDSFTSDSAQECNLVIQVDEFLSFPAAQKIASVNQMWQYISWDSLFFFNRQNVVTCVSFSWSHHQAIYKDIELYSYYQEIFSH